MFSFKPVDSLPAFYIWLMSEANALELYIQQKLRDLEQKKDMRK